MDSWASTIPRERSLLSNRALPPVSTASAYMLSCDFWKLPIMAIAEPPLYMLAPPGDPLVASPSGASAIRAGVHGEESDVGADGGIGGGLELRLVIDTVQTQAAREIQQHLLFVERAEHAHGALQRGKLAIGVEEIELAVVFAEGRAIVGSTIVAEEFVQTLALEI